MKRQIITIDQELCDGCSNCIPACPEGAIQLIDGKARLISDLFCDGLGACLGHCPQGAITIEEREAEPYDERQVMEYIIPQGRNTILAHLEHLKAHGETAFLQQAIQVLNEHGIRVEDRQEHDHHHHGHSCPGSKPMQFDSAPAENSAAAKQVSTLTHWPIQMHLISPRAPQYHHADLLLAADCVAFSVGDFHQTYLRGKALVMACPKLDHGQEIYLEKLVTLIDEAQINTITVMIMQVPCCGGLLALARDAVNRASRHVPIKVFVMGLQGEILSEQWVQ